MRFDPRRGIRSNKMARSTSMSPPTRIINSALQAVLSKNRSRIHFRSILLPNLKMQALLTCRVRLLGRCSWRQGAFSQEHFVPSLFYKITSRLRAGKIGGKWEKCGRQRGRHEMYKNELLDLLENFIKHSFAHFVCSSSMHIESTYMYRYMYRCRERLFRHNSRSTCTFTVIYMFS